MHALTTNARERAAAPRSGAERAPRLASPARLARCLVIGRSAPLRLGTALALALAGCGETRREPERIDVASAGSGDARFDDLRGRAEAPTPSRSHPRPVRRMQAPDPAARAPEPAPAAPESTPAAPEVDVAARDRAAPGASQPGASQPGAPQSGAPPARTPTSESPAAVEEGAPAPERAADASRPDHGEAAPPPDVAPERAPEVAPEPERPALPPGATVARISIDAPRGRRFFARAALPLPSGFEWPEAAPGAPATTPFALAAEGSELAPCQVEVIARGPDGAPEVVELIAALTLPRASRERTDRGRAVLEVRHGEFPAPTASPVAPEVAAWLASGVLVLRASDVHGNPYVAYLLRPTATRALAGGPLVRRMKLSGVMRPDEGADEATALTHTVGVHAYVTLFSGDPRVALDLRIHAGLVPAGEEGAEPAAPAGGLYLDRLELELPAAWTAVAKFPDPSLGAARVEDGVTRLALVAPDPSGALHFFPPAAQLTRRLTLQPIGEPAGDPAFEGLGFPLAGEGHWSWESAETARYSPSRARVPSFAELAERSGETRPRLLERLELRHRQLLRMVEHGTADGEVLHSVRLGWAHPGGRPRLLASSGAASDVPSDVPMRNAASTDDSAERPGFLAIAARERTELERLALLQRLYASRHRVAAWTPAGEPAPSSAGLALPAEGGSAACLHAAEVARQGRRPTYDQGAPFDAGASKDAYDHPSAILGWGPLEGAESAEFLARAAALAWLANDPLAKDDVRHEAARSDGREVSSITSRLAALAAAYALADDAERASLRERIDSLVASPDATERLRESLASPAGRDALRATIRGVYRGVDAERAAALEAMLPAEPESE